MAADVDNQNSLACLTAVSNNNAGGGSASVDVVTEPVDRNDNAALHKSASAGLAAAPDNNNLAQSKDFYNHRDVDKHRDSKHGDVKHSDVKQKDDTLGEYEDDNKLELNEAFDDVGNYIGLLRMDSSAG